MDNLIYVLASNCNKENYYACSGVVGTFYFMIKIVIPVVLIIMGAIGLIKGITTSKDDERSAVYRNFFHKLIVAVVVFLTFSLTQFVFKFADIDSEHGNIITCVGQLIEDECPKYIPPKK